MQMKLVFVESLLQNFHFNTAITAASFTWGGTTTPPQNQQIF